MGLIEKLVRVLKFSSAQITIVWVIVWFVISKVRPDVGFASYDAIGAILFVCLGFIFILIDRKMTEPRWLAPAMILTIGCISVLIKFDLRVLIVSAILAMAAYILRVGKKSTA